MSVKDIASNLEVIKIEDFAVSANGQLVSTVALDMADFEEGLVVAGNCTSYTDGDHVIGFQESSDDGASDPYADIAAEKIIGSDAGRTVDAVTADGDSEKKAGCFSTKRYIKITIDSTGVTTGAAITVNAIRKGELLPVAEA